MTPDARPEKERNVLLFVDDSRNWHGAAKILSRYLSAAGGHVTVLSVMLLPGSRNRVLAEAQRMLELPPGRTRLVGKPGLVEVVLPEAARDEEADLVVFGRLGSADRLTSGLIASHVARRTPANVMVLRGRHESIKRILVCTEGSRHGLRNFLRAVELAQPFQARVDVLHVVSQMALTAAGRDELADDLKDFIASDAPEAEHLRELRARLQEVGLEGDVIVRQGLVVDEILGALHEGGHDLLVIGAHDVAEGHLFEDFAGHILRASPISTLMVRDRKSG